MKYSSFLALVRRRTPLPLKIINILFSLFLINVCGMSPARESLMPP